MDKDKQAFINELSYTFVKQFKEQILHFVSIIHNQTINLNSLKFYNKISKKAIKNFKINLLILYFLIKSITRWQQFNSFQKNQFINSNQFLLSQITYLTNGLRLKQSEMKFKTNPFSHPQFDDHQDHPYTTLPEQRSSILNDTNNSLRSFIQNLRNIVGGEEEQQSEGLIVLFGIDQQTGNLSLGIAKHQVKKIETNLEKYKDEITEAVQQYQHEQTSILQKYRKSLEEITKRKIIYSIWKQKCKQNSILTFFNQGLMNMIQYPRMCKQRSPSNDTVQTLSGQNNYIQVPNDDELSSPLDEMDQSLMQVE